MQKEEVKKDNLWLWKLIDSQGFILSDEIGWGTMQSLCNKIVEEVLARDVEVKPDTNIEGNMLINGNGLAQHFRKCSECGKDFMLDRLPYPTKCIDCSVKARKSAPTPRVPSEFTVKELAYLEKQMVAERFGKEETIDTELNTLDLIGWEVLSGKIKDKIKLLLEQNE